MELTSFTRILKENHDFIKGNLKFSKIKCSYECCMLVYDMYVCYICCISLYMHVLCVYICSICLMFVYLSLLIDVLSRE